MPRYARYILLLALTALCQTVAAADGDLDLTFGQSGKQTIGFDVGDNLIDSAVGVAVIAGKTIYMAGNVDAPLGETRIGLARLLTNGSPDPTFGVKGRVAVTIPGIANPRILDGAAQKDGKLVLVGSVRVGNPVDNDFDFLVCRFHANGELDAGFGNPQTPGCATVPVNFAINGRDVAQAVAVQSNGRIVLAGQATNDAQRAIGVVLRLMPNGSLDGSFGTDGIADFSTIIELNPLSTMALADVAIGGDGKVVVAGHLTSFADSDFFVARFDGMTGQLDPLFSDDGQLLIAFDMNPMTPSQHDRGRRVAILADNSVLVAGDVQIGGDSNQMGVVRLDASGVPDANFGPEGKRAHIFCDVCDNASVSGLLFIDNRILIAGTVSGESAFFKSDFGVMRLMPDGLVDDSFGADGRSLVGFDLVDGNASDRLTAITVQGNRILLAGHVAAPGKQPLNRDFAIARIEN